MAWQGERETRRKCHEGTDYLLTVTGTSAGTSQGRCVEKMDPSLRGLFILIKHIQMWNHVWWWRLTRPIVVITVQYKHILDHCVLYMKLMLYVNYMFLKKKKVNIWKEQGRIAQEPNHFLPAPNHFLILMTLQRGSQTGSVKSKTLCGYKFSWKISSPHSTCCTQSQGPGR